MKHLFVVKRGSLAIWKRLDPYDSNQQYAKSSVRIQNGRSLFL